ncbi:EAL domain-containing protein [Sulfobacillus harzensis]|uniref:EAL domain-containing protein n=1 Tax=Sulfobacillus harzensis TaxID=2729629 RepID=A0A7Y0L0A4_9FIRM|nr:EAL domain-containing protein [Sulfobacillus harzensis]NMP20903.1 EAL domain-containing protein [Sulfobacillus harzensis]
MVSQWLSAPEVHFVLQPFVSLSSAQILGYELLSRPSIAGVNLPVEEFFREASEAGLAVPVDRVLIPQMVEFLDDTHPDGPVFVNLHPDSLRHPAIQSHLESRIGRIVLEVTERAEWVVGEMETFLRGWQNQGGRFALDDFGSGYSGLEKLVSVRPDYVKLDARLVRGADRDRVKQNVIEAVSQLASILSFQLVAEGVEEPGELETCIRLGVSIGQGYYFCPPRPWEERPQISAAIERVILQQHQRLRGVATPIPAIYDNWEYHAALMDDLMEAADSKARLDLICKAIYRTLKPHSVTVMTATDEGLKPWVSVGHAHRQLMSWESPSLARRAFMDGTLAIQQRMETEASESGNQGELNRLLGSPQSVAIFPVGSPPWGVIGADFLLPHAWSPERLNVLKTFARLVSLVVEREGQTSQYHRRSRAVRQPDCDDH